MKKYLALLRGINVGGHNTVKMPLLKLSFERLGFTDVVTYINTGNVIFSSDQSNINELCESIAATLLQDFGFSIPVLLRDEFEIKNLIKLLPVKWANNLEMKCDIVFLWEEIDSPEILKELPEKQDFEDVLYLPGAVIWRIDREYQNKSRMVKIVGTKLYKQVTTRNINTVRKLENLIRIA